jgi:hypothetical protein
MRRNWIIGIVVVALAAVMLLGGQYWVSRRGSSVDDGPQTSISALLGPASKSGIAPIAAQNASASDIAVPPSKASKPAAEGVVLVKLPEAPAKTVGGFAPGQLPANGRYIVTLQPYGFGPDSSGQPTLVFRLGSVTPLPGVAGREKLIGITTVSRISPASVAAYAKGGTYTALLSVATDVRGLALQLSPPISAQAAKQALDAAKARKKK